MALKVKATIHSAKTRELDAEADSYEEARADLDTQVADEWQLTGCRRGTERP